MTSVETGDYGEFAVAQWLRNKGFKCDRCPGKYAPFDIFTSRGTTIEVKIAFPCKAKRRIGWHFNIHRHGKLCTEGAIDFYIFRLESGSVLRELGMAQAIHLVVPASEITCKNLWISFRSLVTQWIGSSNATHLIAESERRKEPIHMALAIIRASRRNSQMAHLQKKYGISNEKIAEATRIVNKDRALAQSRAALRQRIASEALSPAELENEALEPKESS